MGRKKNEKKKVDAAVLDALVEEGKTVDIAKVEQVIADNDKKEDKVEASIEKEDAKIATNREIIEEISIEQPVDVVQTNDDTKETESKDICEEIDSSVNVNAELVDETQDTDTTEDNIDDLIKECTGESERAEDTQCAATEKAPKNDNVPWYVAKALREGDYYNW